MSHKSFLNQFSTQFRRADSTGEAIDFGGLHGSRVRLVNRGGVPWRFSFASTTPSTGGAELRGGEIFDTNFRLPVTGMALATTSTTTSTGTDDTLIEVNAWG